MAIKFGTSGWRGDFGFSFYIVLNREHRIPRLATCVTLERHHTSHSAELGNAYRLLINC